MSIIMGDKSNKRFLLLNLTDGEINYLLENIQDTKRKNKMETDFIKESIGSIIRTLLAPLVGLLSTYLTVDQSNQLISVVAALIVAVIWGVVNKYLWKQRVETALELPANSSIAKLNDVIANK